MNKPLISVLIPTYNGAHFLKTICASVQAQTYGNFEVLIWDDGSTDNTGEVLETVTKDPRFQIFSSKENRGLNRAWFELLNLAKGQFWCSPGVDDVLFPDFLESRLAQLSSEADAVLIHGTPQIIDENGKPTSAFPLLMNLPRKMEGARALRVLLQHNIINQPSALIRMDFTKPLLPLFQQNWKYAPDWYLWILLLSSGSGLLWDSEPKHQYRVHSQSLSLGTEYAPIRRAEIRLVPLCALSAVAHSSPIAASCWQEYGRALYALWLRRAWTLRACSAFQQWWKSGLTAFYGGTRNDPFVLTELGKNAWQVMLNTRAEKKSLARQRFRVSGLAQIDDPVFH